MCLFLNGCGCTSVCIHVCVEGRGEPQMSTLEMAPYTSFETGYLTGLEFTNWARLDCQLVTGIFLPLFQHHWDYKHTPPCLEFLREFWKLNEGLYPLRQACCYLSQLHIPELNGVIKTIIPLPWILSIQCAGKNLC